MTTTPPFTRKPCNEACRQYLISLGCPANIRVRYIESGSLKGCWSIYAPDAAPWNQSLPNCGKTPAFVLNAAGFKGFDGKPLDTYSGNGGTFSTYLRGHNEFLEVA